MVVGPWNEDGAKLFKQEWRDESRKLRSRIEMGVYKAALARKRFYFNTKDDALKRMLAEP